MASGNGLPSSFALGTKHPSALGPFPRYIWIHQDTPQDSLDKTCHEIWKRVQGLPEALQPRPSKELLSTTMAGTPRDNGISFQEEALELGRGKDDISRLVEQEFLSLTREYLVLVTESSGDLEDPGGSPEGPRQPAPSLLTPPLVAGSSGCSQASLITRDKFLEPKVAVSDTGSEQDRNSAMSAVTGILCAAKINCAKGTEGGGHSLGASNSEMSQLPAQFPLKSTEASKARDNKMVEETRVTRDSLQNSMSSGPGPREPSGLGPRLPLPALPPPTPPDKLPVLRRQLPVFAEICSKPKADGAVEGRHWMEQNPVTKEPTKGQESLFRSQWSQSWKDTRGEEGCSDPVGPMSMTLEVKKPARPAEKTLLYEFLGTIKNPSGKLKLRSKVEVDGLDLKPNLPVMVAAKNNLKYPGKVSTPRFATALPSTTTLSQPPWLTLNYPPPPGFTGHSTFPQYQGLYLQWAARMPCQQTLHPQLGCYSQQVMPYNPQQMGQQIFYSSYTRLPSYIPFVQPNCRYPQRTPAKLSTNPRDPSLMAGDGPQYLIPQAYGFGSTSGGPLRNSPYFSSSGNGKNF